MAKKPNINVVATGYQATDTINDNFNNVRNQFENTLSRDGSTPNAMEADLDLNSYDIINVNQINANEFYITGVGSLSQGPQGPTGPQGPAGNGDMNKSVYDINNNGIVDAAASVPFSGITSKPTTLSGYGISDAQPLDADLTSIAGLTGTSGLLRKTALNTFDLGSVKTKMRVFTETSTNTQYIPSAGTTSIIVYLTGAGGSAGSSASVTGTTASTFNAYTSSGGSGAGTLIFSMNATAANTFQVEIAKAPLATAAGTSASAPVNGSSSTFAIILSGVRTVIATAPGGLKGVNNIGDGSSNAFSPVASDTIAVPNSTYVASNNYLAVPGGPGSPGMSAYVVTSGAGGVSGGNGGSSFWGQGAVGGLIKGGGSNTLSVNGINATIYGAGGSGGAGLKRATAAVSATGGSGGPGVCVIIEVIN